MSTNTPGPMADAAGILALLRATSDPASGQEWLAEAKDKLEQMQKFTAELSAREENLKPLEEALAKREAAIGDREAAAAAQVEEARGMLASAKRLAAKCAARDRQLRQIVGALPEA